ncbi:MAG TPA: flagellar biosynthesis protein FlhB [Solirubrobacteraceae bacterium]
MAGEKTEKATPKRRNEARQKGQVARSTDLQGAVVLLAGIVAMGAVGPKIVERMADVLRGAIAQMSSPDVVSRHGIGTLMSSAGEAVLLAVAPIALACVMAGVATSVGMVGFRPSGKALKPDPKRLNPVSGARNIFGPNAIVETLKSIAKVGVVAAIVAIALLPRLPEFGGMVGISPVEFGSILAGGMSSLVKRAALAYFVIGVADFLWQRHRHEKSLKMDKQEVKDEAKEQNLPAEVRSTLRRRQMELSRKRMMAEVPTADVVVTNPTHYSVALRYDAAKADAPEVVAKGQDHIALRIRELAREHGVPVVPDPPLARGLYGSVELGHTIPEEFFGAVAAVLAFVYRTAARRAAA